MSTATSGASLRLVPPGVLGQIPRTLTRHRWSELTTSGRMAVGYAFLDKLQSERGTENANVDAVVGFYDEVALGRIGRWHSAVPPKWQSLLLGEARRSGLILDGPAHRHESRHYVWGIPLLGLGALLVFYAVLFTPGATAAIMGQGALFVAGCAAVEAGLAATLLQRDYRGAPSE